MKKHSTVVGMVMGIAMSACAIAPAARAEYQPEQWILDARKAFADQRFGIMICWGIYANYAQGEWYLEQGGVDEKTYSEIAGGFYPSNFNAREWVKLFKDAGAKYVTLISRHHDGFSLWPSQVDDGYNIANTPFKRDIVGELAEACREEGLQLNLYYSLMDWHRLDYPTGGCRAARSTLPPHTEDYASYRKFMIAQITELLDRYHPGNIWFDGEWDAYERDWDLDEIYDLIHSKGALVANNTHRPIREKEDIQLFERDLPGENATGFSAGQTVAQDRPIEQCDVIQENVWGFRIAERRFRPPEEVVAMVCRAAAKNSNLLINIGPQGDGRLPDKAVEVLKGMGQWFRENGDAIYGTRAGGEGDGKNLVSTRKGDTLYLITIPDSGFPTVERKKLARDCDK